MPRTPPTPRTPRTLSPSALLWASAFVLAGLTIVQLGKIDAGRGDAALAELPAGMMSGAEQVSHVGDYTVLTFNGGNEDILAILDGRSEELYTYRVKNQTQFEFLGRDKLSDMFLAARRMGFGGSIRK